MELPIYQVDAFADRLFAGNPAAIVPLDAWLDAGLMQAIAAENNLAETAFIVPQGADWGLRWFTPAIEVPLCGHATLASAHVIATVLRPGTARMVFHSASGPLTVTRSDDGTLSLDFPSRAVAPTVLDLGGALGGVPVETWDAGGGYAMAVYADESEVRALAPDMVRVGALDCLGIIATAPARATDFVSRFFAPKAGIPEDPVTGSAHCTLAPYWAKRLGRAETVGFQASARGGLVRCRDRGDRVDIAGTCVTYLEGRIRV
jgi:PhzF family phenazine biosynthesis protein